MHEVCVNCRRNFVDSHQIQCTNWYKNPNQKMNLPQKSQGMYKSTFIINSLTFDYICELSRNMDPYQISTISKHASPNFLLADRAKRDKGQHH
jgi:hypothetical protein